MLSDVIKQFCNLIGLQDSYSRVQITVELDARPLRFVLVVVALPDYEHPDMCSYPSFSATEIPVKLLPPADYQLIEAHYWDKCTYLCQLLRKREGDYTRCMSCFESQALSAVAST